MDPSFWNREDSQIVIKELGDYKKEINTIELLKEDSCRIGTGY